MNIVLASGSPRRKELLAKLGFEFKVVSVDTDESYPSGLAIDMIAEYIAEAKFEASIKGVDNNTLVITADTIVVLGNEVLGKPYDLVEANTILEKLSNSWHSVITGVCIGTINKKECFSVTSNVFIEKLSESEINYYIENFKVLDKAGSYGIQDWLGLAKISKIEGSYFNIMGLPTHELYERIKLFELN